MLYSRDFNDCARVFHFTSETWSQHLPDCTKILPCYGKTSSEHAPHCARVLPFTHESCSEHVPNYTTLLPSNNDYCSEHVFDSMECCVVDELLPGYCMRVIFWRKEFNWFPINWQTSLNCETGKVFQNIVFFLAINT